MAEQHYDAEVIGAGKGPALPGARQVGPLSSSSLWITCLLTPVTANPPIE